MDLITRYDKAGTYSFKKLKPILTKILKTVIADGNLIPFYYDKEIGTAFHLKEVLENLLIFVPMGIYLQMLLPKRRLHTKLIIIAGTSLLLEALQYVLAIGRSDITDLLTNTAGGLLGLVLYCIVARLLGNRVRADKLFLILAVIVSAIVIGLLALILLMN